MKGLMEAIRARLLDQLPELGTGDAAAVHYLVDEAALPEYAAFSCVGLKDGESSQHYYGGGARQKAELYVDVVSYVQIQRYEAGIIGHVDQPGILDLEEKVRTALEWWSPSGYHWMSGDVSETPSRAVNLYNEAGEAVKAVQMKKFTMKWTKG